MMGRTLALTALMAGALAVLGPWLDGVTLDDHSHEVQQAKDLEDAQRAAQARQRFERAAQTLCGPQSAWREVDHNSIECTARRGLRSVVLQLKKELP